MHFFVISVHRCKHVPVKITTNDPPLIYYILHPASNGQKLFRTGTFSLPFFFRFSKPYPSIIQTACRFRLDDFEQLVRRYLRLRHEVTSQKLLFCTYRTLTSVFATYHQTLTQPTYFLSLANITQKCEIGMGGGGGITCSCASVIANYITT